MNHPLLRRIAALVCAALLLAACGTKETPKRISYDLSGKPETIDPQFAVSQSAATIITNTFEGLTRLDSSGQPQAACAERWEVSADGLTYTFLLRDGLTWANGDPLTAHDFVFAIGRLFGETPAPDAENFMMIENAAEVLDGSLPVSALGLQAPDDRTLIIRLSTPNRSLPLLLASPAAMPCHERFFNEQKGRYGLSPEKTLGNGPFVVESWSEQSVVLTPNPAYRTPPAIERVTLYLDRGDAIQLFLDGKSDGVLADFHRLSELSVATGEMNYNQTWVLLFNPGDGCCADIEVRHALLSALDIEAVTSLLPSSGIPAQGIIPPDSLLSGLPYRKIAGSSPQPAPSAADPRALLQQALARLGLADVGRLSLLVPDFGSGPALGSQMQKCWQESLSSFINMEQLPYEELLSRVQRGDYSLAIAPLLSQGNSTVDFLSRFAQPPFRTDAIAGLLESAQSRVDPQESAADLLAAEQLLIDDFLVLPLFYAPTCFVLREGVEGVRYLTASRTVYFADAVIR